MRERHVGLALIAGLLMTGTAVRPSRAQGAPAHPAGGTAVADAAPDSPNVRGALAGSLKLLFLEHGVRIAAQEKTRRELGGSFFGDYKRSVRMPRTWGDTDGWVVNYVGHPLHGAAAGFIWASHDPVTRRAEFGRNSRYWATRWRAVAWSAGYSLQFELGPFSEASIGNVGKRPETIGWVDHVMTPLGAFGVIAAEDAVDRLLLGRLEDRIGHPAARALLRMALNPARSMANVAMSRPPWHRDTRPLVGRE